MVREIFKYPDLDVLDSPLVSPTPLTSIGGVPGSAIADKIFNDPDSWEENGIDRFNIRPISFFESDEDIQAQLSKILDSGGFPHHVPPLSSVLSLSPPSTASSCNTPLHANTATIANSTENGYSPVAIYSGSATLSLLEWYDIYTDIDQKCRNLVNPARRGMQVYILPPGLDPPSRSPIPIPSRPKPSTPRLNTNSEVLSRSYARSPSPTRPKPNSNSSSHSSSNLRSQLHTDTPVQGISDTDSNEISRRRPLPPIPQLPSAGSISLPSLPTGIFSSLPPQLSTSRPLLTRPLMSPAGPRPRTSQSRMNGQDTTSRSTSLGHRPPVLKL